MLRRKQLFLFAVLVLVACAQDRPPSTPAAVPAALTTVPVLPTPAPGTLVVEPSAVLGPISPYLLGSNYGPWVSVPVDMLPAAYDSGVTVIRFPGGAWGDRNDLRPYQVDYFIEFTRNVAAAATISVRLRQGSPEQAADLVRYVNVQKQYHVVYWSIGNEPTLFAQELRTLGVADDYDTVQFNREWREFAQAMKAVDPAIRLVGPELHQFTFDEQANPKDSSGRDWMVEFLKANGDMVDVVSFHRYPYPAGEDHGSIEGLRMQTREWRQTIPYLRGLIQEITGRDIPIAITEVNTHWNKAAGGEATPDSHYNAVWLAETMGQLMRHDLFMFNHWMLTSDGSLGVWGLIGRGQLRPSYYVYQLYRRFGHERIYAESGLEDVSIYAANHNDGSLTMMIINLAGETKQTTLLLPEGRPTQAELWRLDETQMPESSSSFTLPADGALSLPPHSISLLITAGME